MILPLRVFGTMSTKFNSPMTATGPSSRRTCSSSSTSTFSEGWKPCLTTTKADHLSAQFEFGPADHGRFRAGRMTEQRRLYFDGADAVSQQS